MGGAEVEGVFAQSRLLRARLCLGWHIAAAIELAQLLVLSRFTDATDVVLGTIGAAIGAKLVFRRDERGDSVGGVESLFQARSALPWLALLAGYSLFLVAGFGTPLQLRGIMRHPRRLDDFLSRVPFLSLYSRIHQCDQATAGSRADVAPISADLGEHRQSREDRGFQGDSSVRWGHCTTAAFGIELAEVLMPDKTADSTESCCA